MFLLDSQIWITIHSANKYTTRSKISYILSSYSCILFRRFYFFSLWQSVLFGQFVDHLILDAAELTVFVLFLRGIRTVVDPFPRPLLFFCRCCRVGLTRASPASATQLVLLPDAFSRFARPFPIFSLWTQSAFAFVFRSWTVIAPRHSLDWSSQRQSHRVSLNHMFSRSCAKLHGSSTFHITFSNMPTVWFGFSRYCRMF